MYLWLLGGVSLNIWHLLKLIGKLDDTPRAGRWFLKEKHELTKHQAEKEREKGGRYRNTYVYSIKYLWPHSYQQYWQYRGSISPSLQPPLTSHSYGFPERKALAWITDASHSYSCYPLLLWCTTVGSNTGWGLSLSQSRRGFQGPRDQEIGVWRWKQLQSNAS